jgi:hypothetical protein
VLGSDVEGLLETVEDYQSGEEVDSDDLGENIDDSVSAALRGQAGPQPQ